MLTSPGDISQGLLQGGLQFLLDVQQIVHERLVRGAELLLAGALGETTKLEQLSFQFAQFTLRRVGQHRLGQIDQVAAVRLLPGQIEQHALHAKKAGRQRLQASVAQPKHHGQTSQLHFQLAKAQLELIERSDSPGVVARSGRGRVLCLIGKRHVI
jgi:hypothetical protein